MSQPMILVVEDEPSIAENVEYCLGTEGFEVRLCSTGGDALSGLAAGWKPELVILDVGLPDQSGFDVCRQIRQTSQIPILFLTARESEIDRVVGLELGADDYVTKPFSPRELAARVRAILRRASALAVADGPPEADADQDFVIDEERRQIRFAGEALPLTRYEYGLLALLVRHPGRVYTRDQLMDHVWEEPEAAMDRTVDAHIKTLRAKLREHSSEELIVTHRGVGYSMAER